MRGGVAALLTVFCGSCASGPGFHQRLTGMNVREQRALLSASRNRADGFERFWARPNCRFGLVKWSDQQSRSVEEAPGALLNLIRDEIGRVNRAVAEGEIVFVTVIVFRWQRRLFGRAPRGGLRGDRTRSRRPGHLARPRLDGRAAREGGQPGRK
jgi:hypothetical protein